MNANTNKTKDESKIRDLIENWAKAVRAKDLSGIIANHSTDILMFDVPPPIRSKGLNEYERTWAPFYSWAGDLGVFDILEMDVTAGNDVAFATAMMHCAGTDTNGRREDLDFRLTVGLKKIDGEWTITHEHHSVPAT
jgi:uncharacterized protein (TIGR02246 family)